MSGKLNEAYKPDSDEERSNTLGLRWRTHDLNLQNPRNTYQDDVGLNMEKLEENNRADNMEDKKDNLADRDETTDPLYTPTPLPGGNFASKILLYIRDRIDKFRNDNQSLISCVFRICFGVLVCVYLGFVIKNWNDKGRPSFDWCRGTGILFLLVIFICWCMFYYIFVKPILYKQILRNYITEEMTSKTQKISRITSTVLLCLFVTCLFIFVIYDSYSYMRRLISFAGIFVFIFCGFICSKHPANIPWKTVVVGTLMQYSIGLLAIRWQMGREIFMCIGNTTEAFLRFAYEGATMVYGKELVVNQAVFAFQALSVIFFMSMVVQVLFYFGWMQIFCKKLGWFVQFFMGTTVCESVNAVSSVFLGMSEALFLYKPYIKDLTTSEIHAVMVGGLSTVAGTLFAAYTALGANPAHLITASVMTAPAALMYAKILFPETEKSKTNSDNFKNYKSEDTSVVDAATQGAISGVGIVQSIIASVIAAVSVVALANSLVSWLLSEAGVGNTNLESLISYILIPVAWLMGVKPDNCIEVARLIGIKTIVNEFVGYAELGKIQKAGLLTARSEAIATYAMCSFANPGSVAIITANLLTLCPQQRINIISVSIRAFFGGVITSLLTACVAGSLMPEEGYPNLEL